MARARASLAATGLCLSDSAALDALLHGGPLGIGELGRHAQLTSSSITTSVDRLEREGLVKRGPSEHHRRARIVHLAPHGKSLIRTHVSVRERDMTHAFGIVSDGEQAALFALLRKLTRGVSEFSRAAPAGPYVRHKEDCSPTMQPCGTGRINVNGAEADRNAERPARRPLATPISRRAGAPRARPHHRGRAAGR